MKKISLLLLSFSLGLLAACGSVNANATKTTEQPSKEGWYVIAKEGDSSVLVVKAEPQDFSENGGVSEFYDMIYFRDVQEVLEIGQRVIIEPDGGVAESFPAQAKAKSVKVLPVYKPNGADLDEVKVVQEALKTVEDSSEWKAVTDVQYDQEKDEWTVGLKVGEEKHEIIVKDE